MANDAKFGTDWQPTGTVALHKTSINALICGISHLIHTVDGKSINVAISMVERR